VSLPALVPDRPADVERVAQVGEAFTFAPADPAWRRLTGDRAPF
jgi:hypothetical protein